MPTVVLHVGAFKTGTSFLQQTLSDNRETLADRGILVPADRSGSVFHLFRSFWTGRDGPPDPASTALVAQCLAWEGSHAVISAERLSLLRPGGVARLVAAFAPHPVRVVLGARDLVRTVPSQWQSFARGRTSSRWTYREYVAGVVAGAQSGPAGRMFWERHDWPAIIDRWGAHAGRDCVRLMTVPHTSTGPDELWWRFAEAAGFDPRGYRCAATHNTSLGAQSAEVVRRVNQGLAEWPRTPGGAWVDEDHVLRVMARKSLADRASDELRVAFPPEYGAWADEKTAELVSRLDDLAPVVVGDLRDLAPVVPTETPPHATTRPESLPPEQILAAARYALASMRRTPRDEPADSGPPSTDASTEDQLDATIAALVRTIRRRARRQRSVLPGEDSNPY